MIRFRNLRAATVVRIADRNEDWSVPDLIGETPLRSIDLRPPCSAKGRLGLCLRSRYRRVQGRKAVHIDSQRVYAASEAPCALGPIFPLLHKRVRVSPHNRGRLRTNSPLFRTPESPSHTGSVVHKPHPSESGYAGSWDRSRLPS